VTLRELLAHAARLLKVDATGEQSDAPVTALAYDSRQVRPGAVFFALRGVNADRPVVGVFTQGIQMAKIAYYVDTAVDLQERETRPDGSRELVVTVSYTSRVDAGEVPGLSPYIVGPEESRPGEIRLRALVYAPAGGGFASGSENSEHIGLSPQKHDELWLSFRDITLRPGATSSVTYVIITGKHQDGDVILRTTPGPRPVKVSIEE